MFLGSYLRTGFLTTMNILLNALTLGRFVWLEGRVRRGAFHNWGHRFRFRPAVYARPTSEAEIAELVLNARQVRVFGSGHSFNSGVVTDETLVSLDRYTGILWVDQETRRMSVRAGTRIRDINRALKARGWAFQALPSHDAQSIGGILSTDVHGTGRDWGFVSQAVVKLKLVDGLGQVVDCTPADDLFKAAIGGIGAVGIIVEVVIQAVEAFRVRQKSELMDLAYAEANLDQLIDQNDHLSLYIFAFCSKCRVNSWNHSDRPLSRFGAIREFGHHAVDALASVWFADLLAHLRLLPQLSEFVVARLRGAELVLESSAGFNRTIYHAHHELEFAVPYEETFAVLRQFIELYAQRYSEGLPFVAFEVRFTPADHDRTLLGAGRGRRTAWIDLLCNDSSGFETFLDAAEKLLKTIEARPHLGKYCVSIDADYLQQVHGDHFMRFRQLVQDHDPEARFANAFTNKLFRAGVSD